MIQAVFTVAPNGTSAGGLRVFTQIRARVLSRGGLVERLGQLGAVLRSPHRPDRPSAALRQYPSVSTRMRDSTTG